MKPSELIDERAQTFKNEVGQQIYHLVDDAMRAKIVIDMVLAYLDERAVIANATMQDVVTLQQENAKLRAEVDNLNKAVAMLGRQREQTGLAQRVRDLEILTCGMHRC